jgi:hypothetical protein
MQLSLVQHQGAIGIFNCICNNTYPLFHFAKKHLSALFCKLGTCNMSPAFLRILRDCLEPQTIIAMQYYTTQAEVVSNKCFHLLQLTNNFIADKT